MPRILTTNAQILCPHGGKGISIPTGHAFGHSGGVCLDMDAGTLSCVFVPPCAGYQLRSLKLNSTFVRGRHVMLETDFLQSFTGFPLTVIETHVVHDNTPPPGMSFGESGPPPQLKTDDKPTVMVAPPVGAFSLTTQMPPTIPFVFTMSSAYPRLWTMWHLTPVGMKMDITNGLPGNINVIPPGGKFLGQQMVISVTIMGTYASTMVPGLHTIVCTAVNHRGMSAFAEAKLTISP